MVWPKILNNLVEILQISDKGEIETVVDEMNTILNGWKGVYNSL